MSGKRIHFISIGGAVMHNLAIDLKTQGNTVTGSDDEIFEPSLSRLQEHGLLPKTFGWKIDNIHPQLDFIILGMHARSDNPELIKAKEMGIKVYSFPEYVFEQSRNKLRVVVAGSHGKTTTTAMIMHALKSAGMPFDYLVGSQLSGFSKMVSITDAPVIIIEGDEYLTSPIDLKPKFLWYKPHIAQITGIAWDHINVFPTFENYLEQFRLFIESIEPRGWVFWFGADEHVKQLMQQSKVQHLPYNTPEYRTNNRELWWIDGGKEYPLQVFGEHNLQNMQGALMVCQQLGINKHQFLESMTHFEGTARRLEPVQAGMYAAVYRDFAHAPSKVKATVQAMAERFTDKKLLSVLELHTFSSLRADFIPHYKDSLEGSAVKAIYLNPHVFEMKKMPVLPESLLKDAFGSDTLILDTKEKLESLIKQYNKPEYALLMMSSGSFDGINLSVVLS